MKITIVRFAFKRTYTIGRLYIGEDMHYLCDTMEPRSCHLTSRASDHTILKRKAANGVIAIPTDTYGIRMARSLTFKRQMPFLTGVKCFSGIMLHPGNYPCQTRGCILPGWNRRKGMVCGSRSAFAMVMQRIGQALARKEKVTITIKERDNKL